jgi:hypothetical protein
VTTNNGDGSGPVPTEQPGPPVPLVLSIAFGVLGSVLLVAGLVGGSPGLAVGGFAAGSLSLGAALYWRSLLISSWAAQKRGRPPG